MKTTKYNIDLNMINCVSLDGKGFFGARNYNGMFSVSKGMDTCELVTQDTNGICSDDKSFYTQCIHGIDEIIASPFNANTILIYNLNNQQTYYIPLEMPHGHFRAYTNLKIGYICLDRNHV